jgi:hypothetical protein
MAMARTVHSVEGFFAKLTNRRFSRGVFRCVAELKAAVERFIAETNADPKPFVWTARPTRILAAVKRGKQALESVHYPAVAGRLTVGSSLSCAMVLLTASYPIKGGTTSPDLSVRPCDVTVSTDVSASDQSVSVGISVGRGFVKWAITTASPICLRALGR